jgi:ATP-dependent Clp protease ATP-binding subunit ClpB
VLDDGRLTDGQGRVVNFSNCVIILTSNLGAQALLKDPQMAAGKGISDSARALVMDAVHKHLLPEFINRLDDMVIFSPLSKPQLRQIVKISLESVAKRLAVQDIDIVVRDAAADWIAEKSYDPTFGARPLRRFVEKELVTKLSRMIISESLSEHSRLEIGMAGDAFTFSVTKKDPNAAPAKKAKTQTPP